MVVARVRALFCVSYTATARERRVATARRDLANNARLRANATKRASRRADDPARRRAASPTMRTNTPRPSHGLLRYKHYVRG